MPFLNDGLLDHKHHPNGIFKIMRDAKPCLVSAQGRLVLFFRITCCVLMGSFFTPFLVYADELNGEQIELQRIQPDAPKSEADQSDNLYLSPN